MMKKGIKLIAAALMGIAAVGCSSVDKMAKLAENVKVTCEPEVLEAVAGNIDADITVTYPAKYFHPKAILEVTPVLVYDGGEAAMKPFVYQGEKVKDNYKTVSAAGQTVRERAHFDYVEGMEQATLELRGVVRYKSKAISLPAKKVADGTNTTYMLVDADGYFGYRKDNYQEIIKQTEEGQILYKINSSDVAGKELKNQSIKDFQAALDAIAADARRNITSTEVVAYASPDGGKSLNDKLSDKRSKSADKAWDKVMKGKNVADPELKSVGQDWEGFQSLVANSNLEDKDLILRVLSMYSDPAVRENEIKNMSEVYTSLKSTVLPELRRARFIANVEYQNYSSDELLALVDENIDVLDEEALLRAATLVRDNGKKISLYKKAIDKYGSDRAQFNLGVAYLAADKIADAEKAFANVKETGADLDNIFGVIAMRKGNFEEAGRLFNKAGNDLAKANRGVVEILTGNYSAAAADLKDFQGCCYNKTLALILNDELDAAEAGIKCKDIRLNYLRAIIAARRGDAEGVAANLDKIKNVKDLAARAEKDIEFAQYR
ncbi:MAG: hypothetical protein J6U28_09730 [Bacteroidales bacterium]|nr:hypothetical protein [Bacteroidales bacterium]